MTGESHAADVGRDLLAMLLHRIDAWGVGLIVCLVALLVHDAIAFRPLLLALGLAGMYGLGYAVNDWFDAPHDARDAAKVRVNFFVRHPVPPRRAARLFAVGFALFAGPFFAYGTRGATLLAIATLVLWSYSAPPLRLKARPGLDLLTHAVFVQTYAYAACVLAIGARWARVDIAVLLANFCASLSGQLAQQLRDYAVDSVTERTFTTAVGQRTAARCLRLVTLAMVGVVLGALGAHVLPLRFAPLAVAFAPAALARVRAPRRSASRMIAAGSTAAALAYTGLLVAIHATS